MKSATIRGAEAIPVEVEVIISNGMPGFSIVGMPDTAVYEARERVRAALRSCNFKLPGEKVVFNLAPSSVKKSGSGFDLPMAVALLAATGQISTNFLADKLVVGELSLDGCIKPVQGLVAYQMCAFQHGMDLLCAPSTNVVRGLGNTSKVYTAESLLSFVEGTFNSVSQFVGEGDCSQLDYAEVGGHRLAKRALQISAAGNHSLLMMGPPGSGKTMLAKRLPTILPRLTTHEIAESACIASIAGESIDGIIEGMRPFRSPHHSATMAGLIGGGNPVRPGEVSLAHNGVLMLDELPEFSHSVLQGLRQPIEDGKVVITRAEGSVVMPAQFMLVASSNPCPCGYFGDRTIECSCPLPKVLAYQARIGGPLIDRFDMCIDVWRSDFDEVVAGDRELNSESLRSGVEAARAYAFERFKQEGVDTAQVNSVSSLMEVCRMDLQAKHMFKQYANKYVLSGRGIMRVLRVARTIADLAESPQVHAEHVVEALTLRVRGAQGERKVGCA